VSQRKRKEGHPTTITAERGRPSQSKRRRKERGGEPKRQDATNSGRSGRSPVAVRRNRVKASSCFPRQKKTGNRVSGASHHPELSQALKGRPKSKRRSAAVAASDVRTAASAARRKRLRSRAPFEIRTAGRIDSQGKGEAYHPGTGTFRPPAGRERASISSDHNIVEENQKGGPWSRKKKRESFI